MLAIIKTVNGVKKIIPLTADAGAGNPVGTIIPMYKKSSPSGYLYCDGSTFDETAYPLLYAYLGTNVLPDYREFALVGAEENTTDVYNATTNPNGTIHNHDVYTEGQAKDDQLQDHQHKIVLSPAQSGSGQQLADQGLTGNYSTGTVSSSARSDTVTRGKRKAVYFYIKATSGLSENAQDNVLNTINQNLSYSTTEHKTGKKWIDGKDIYEQTFEVGLGVTAGTWVDIVSKVSVPDIAKLITHSETWGNNEQAMYASAVGITPSTSAIIRYPGVDTASVTLKTIHLEYTKTTD